MIKVYGLMCLLEESILYYGKNLGKMGEFN